MGGDGQALCNKRRFLVNHGRGMHKAAGGGGGVDGAATGVGSALAAARKRMRDEVGSSVAPNSIEWHAIPVDQQVGRCRASLESLPALSIIGDNMTTPSAAVVDLAGYVYSATALVDFLLARATAKKSAPVVETTTTPTPPQAVDPLSHIRKFKRDVFGLVLVGGGSDEPPNPFDCKIPQNNRSICIVPKTVEGVADGGGGSGSRCGYVLNENTLREYWLYEINSQLKGMKTQSSAEAQPTTTTSSSSPGDDMVVLTAPRSITSSSSTGGGKGDVVFTLSQALAQYIRTWILSRPLTTTFDHSVVLPAASTIDVSSSSSNTVPMATRLKQHTVIAEGVTGGVSRYFQSTSLSSSSTTSGDGGGGDALTTQLEELAKSVSSTNSNKTPTSSDVTTSSSSCSRLPWFTELRVVVALSNNKTNMKHQQGQLVELFPRSMAEATLSLAISHHEHN